MTVSRRNAAVRRVKTVSIAWLRFCFRKKRGQPAKENVSRELKTQWRLPPSETGENEIELSIASELIMEQSHFIAI